MKTILQAGLVLVAVATAGTAWGHGFALSVNENASDIPISITAASQAAYFDEYQLTPGPNNLFIEDFSGTPTTDSTGTYYTVVHGFASTAGPFPPYTATFNVISPLYFSNGVGVCAGGAGPAVAEPASTGTYLQMWDRDGSDPSIPGSQPIYPGASPSNILLNINGSASFYSGFSVSLYDPHELEHSLYLASGTYQTYGEYGFAYDVVVTFQTGPSTTVTITTGPLIDVYALSDPNLGDFADNAPPAQQDAATLAIYNAAYAAGIGNTATGLGWTGAAGNTWADAANWAGDRAPGATTGTLSTDTALFNSNPANGAPTIDAGRNLQNITFDSAAVGALTLGTTAGNPLLLTSQGAIQTTATIVNPQTINAPLVIEGAGGTYTFISGAASSAATLSFGGNITGGAAGNTVLTLAGANSGANTIEGAIGNGLATSLALVENGPGNWILAGPNTYTGGTTVNQGTLTVAAAGTLGASSGGLTINAMGTGILSVMNIDGSQTVGSLFGSVCGAGSAAALNIAAGATFAVDQSSATTFAGTLNLAAGTSAAFATFAKQGSGTLELDAAPMLGGDSEINVSGGTLRFNVASGAATIGSGVTATIASGATLELDGSVAALSPSVNIVNDSQAATTGGLHVTGANQLAGQITGTGNIVVEAGASLTAYQIVQNSLTIHGTGTTPSTAGSVTLLPSGSGSTTNPTGPNNINYCSTLTSLAIDNNGDAPGSGNTVYYGTLDIGNNGLVIAYGSGKDPYASIDDMIRSGFDAAHWDGTGITSSLGRAAANSHTPLNIGLVDFTPGSGNYSKATFIVFEGQTITTSAILIRLTYMDDIVLAGDMSSQDASSDALIFAANYGTGTTWSVGDLEHTGLVDSADALLFAANYTPPLPSLDGSMGGAILQGDSAAVPEPSSAALAVLAACGLVIFAERGKQLRR